jgi:hypothetical protein
MSQLDPATEQVFKLVKQLPIASQYTLFSVLKTELHPHLQEPDLETQDWLEADLGEDFPPYEWGAEGIPTGKPVRYVSGRGLVVEGSKDLAI